MNKYKLQVNQKHYFFDSYLSIERWSSYYHQLRNVFEVSKKLKKDKLKILVIGVGDNIVPSVLKSLGHNVSTLDFDIKLKPDFVQELPEVKIKTQFDCILCSQVLEHIKYIDVEKTISKFSQISKYLIVSLPNRKITFSISIKPWFFSSRKFVFSLYNPFKFRFRGEHYWELGDHLHSPGSFIKSAEDNKYKSINNYIVPDFPYHHFFLFEFYES